MEKVFCIACGSICEVPTEPSKTRTTNLNKIIKIPKQLTTRANSNVTYIEILKDLIKSMNLQLPFLQSDTTNLILCEQCTILLEEYNRFGIEIKIITEILTEQLIENYNLQTHSASQSDNLSISSLLHPNNAPLNIYTKDSNNLYQCQFCPKFATLKTTRFISHMKCHQFCEESFPFNRDEFLILPDETTKIFNEQVNKLKPKLLKDLCKKNEKIIPNEKKIIVDDLRGDFDCNFCHKKFKNITGLLRHKKRKHLADDPEIRENLKLKKAHKEVDIWLDSQKRSLNKLKKCENCGDKLSDPNKICEHSSFIGKTVALVCEDCDDEFYSNELLNKHYEKKHMKCFKCKKVFRKVMTLTKHFLSCVDEKFKCEICGQLCVNKAARIKHIQIHTGNKKFPCDKCTKKYTTSYHLRQHCNSVHKTEVLYTCDICQATFNNTFRLSYHRRTHSDQLTIKCKYKGCPMTFLHYSNRSAHVRSHHKLQFFQCEFCGKKFAQNFSLKTHLQRHTGVSLYPCNLCPSKFSRRYILKLHIKKFHPDPEEIST